MSDKKAERAELFALLQQELPTQGYMDIQRLTTKLLSAGFRHSPTLLNQTADAMQAYDPARPVKWLRERAGQ